MENIKNDIKISICMIVKDEELVIGNCLESVKSYVDEIIVVDTGSTDKTKSIASIYTKNIYDFTWSDDFAAARNYSISKASNDWILVLDADEAITAWDDGTVKKFISEEQRAIGRISILNETIDVNKNLTRIQSRVGRLFNKNYFEYKGIIHEQLAPKEDVESKIMNLDIEVKHTGYMEELLKRKNKFDRNIELIKKEIESGNKDPYMYYQLGKSQFLKKEYDESVKSFEKALSQEDSYRYEYFEDLVESYGYSLVNAKEYKKALNILKYEELYGDSPDYCFLLGIIYMNNGMFEDSVKTYKRCIESNKEPKVEGTNTYKAYYNIGVIYECLGYKEEANKYYKKCKDYRLAIERLKL